MYNDGCRMIAAECFEMTLSVVYPFILSFNQFAQSKGSVARLFKICFGLENLSIFLDIVLAANA